MRDITHKFRTLRTARARGRLRSGDAGMQALRSGSVPKGDPYRIAETAAHAAVSFTPFLVPHCHPVRVEDMNVDFELDGDGVEVTAGVRAVEKTGMEMEALTAASVALLNLYDLLKPLEDDLEIEGVQLVSKSGGYRDFRDEPIRARDLTAAVVVTSDGTYEGTREDRSGKILESALEEQDFDVVEYGVLPDDRDRIEQRLVELCDRGIDFVATTGGTGPGPRDVTVEATRSVLDRELPGVAEIMRSEGHDRTPYAMFSRGVVGQRGPTLIVNFPGSSGGTREGLDALFPGLHHFFRMRGAVSGGHGEGPTNG